MSSGERFALVHSSIPFASSPAHVKKAAPWIESKNYSVKKENESLRKEVIFNF
ncbi:hypothetical protein LEP1GSC035_4675 [Leptospira noguchii str. 2007001578]|uniref:Uncharacterized protein n=1 Tax=Leptospira noguchii str. 2007001578 TaxID=1049974 RepID=A0ABP2TC24_9LEPT|nr:hypothetical protein LEP1GSC035_4675 [Leptospira noguchii str. 2007001578]